MKTTCELRRLSNALLLALSLLVLRTSPVYGQRSIPLYFEKQVDAALAAGRIDGVGKLPASTLSRSVKLGVNAAPSTVGTIYGSGNFTIETIGKGPAQSESEFAFVNRTENGAKPSRSPEYEFNISSDRTLIANFARVFRIDVAATFGGGSTDGSGSYTADSEVSVTASPEPGYSFLAWTENGDTVSTSSTYTFAATANRYLVANFIRTFTILVSNDDGGVVAGGGIFAAGSTVSVTFSPYRGSAFWHWTENGKVVSTSAIYEFTASADRILIASSAEYSGGGIPFVLTQTHEAVGSFLKITLTSTALKVGVVWRRKGAGEPFISTSDRRRLPYGAYTIEYGIARDDGELQSYYQSAVDLPPGKELELTFDYSSDSDRLHFGDISLLEDGSIKFEAIGSPLIKIRLDESDDLFSWSALPASEKILDSKGKAEFTFPAKTGVPKRLFRARILE